LMSACLAGCASPEGSFCEVSRPIYLDSIAGKSVAEKRAIQSHNEKGEALCGWEPVHD
ncbi:hypothetical protein SAMN05444272_2743, partial [Roseibium suaedae]